MTQHDVHTQRQVVQWLNWGTLCPHARGRQWEDPWPKSHMKHTHSGGLTFTPQIIILIPTWHLKTPRSHVHGHIQDPRWAFFSPFCPFWRCLGDSTERNDRVRVPSPGVHLTDLLMQPVTGENTRAWREPSTEIAKGPEEGKHEGPPFRALSAASHWDRERGGACQDKMGGMLHIPALHYHLNILFPRCLFCFCIYDSSRLFSFYYFQK